MGLVCCIVMAGDVLAALSISVLEENCAALGIDLEAGTYSVTSNSLSFGRADLEYFSGGTLVAGPISLVPFPLSADLEMIDSASGRRFRIENAHIGIAKGNLHILNGDIFATADTSDSTVFSVVPKVAIGQLNVSAPLAPEGAPPRPAGATPCATNFGPQIDVRLSALNSVQSVARSGGVAALSMSTRITNDGANDVPWFWAINPPGPIQPVIGQHPYLVLHIYRLYNGIFRMIGKTEVKHAFYSTNVGCGCGGAQVIFTGCEDVYGVFNNSEQFYFAPRAEINAFSGSWSSSGSYFDVTSAEPVADNIRSRYSESDAFVNRLTVNESSISVTDAQYFAEAWYLVQGDTNTYSSMGWREIQFFLTNGMWVASNLTALANGPALNAFVPLDSSGLTESHTAIDTAEGVIHHAVSVTALGTGIYRFVYTLLNLNFDRGIQSFEIPVSPGVTVTNVEFADADFAGTNDWSFTASDGTLRWDMVASNGLTWGTMFTFSFEADAPPAPAVAEMLADAAGATNQFRASSLSPGMRISAVGSDSGVEITWPAISGAVYGIESAGSIGQTTWLDSGLSVTAEAGLATVLDTNEPETIKFYRLNLQSAP